MRIAIFDCPLGIAGDMTVGAFLDAGFPFDVLKEELLKLRIKGYSLQTRRVRCGAFRASKFTVRVKPVPVHGHTSLNDISRCIRKSRLHPKIQELAIRIFRHLGRAESRVHGVPLQKIHFHEVGAVDSIVDIVGTAVCFHHLGIKRAYVRKISVGSGVTGGCHGRMPIPVPGAYELLKGFSLDQSRHTQEMVTPTGAAILRTTCVKNDRIPKIKLLKIGYGAGDRIFDGVRGMLRVSLGDRA